MSPDQPLPTLPRPLAEGVLSRSAYADLRTTPFYGAIGDFAAGFRRRNPDLVDMDPFRQWSRGWEYPLAIDALLREIPEGGEARVLEAGCGFTFFPFLMSQARPGASFTCVDGDPSHGASFDAARGEAAGHVEFRQSFLETLADDDDAYDAVTCISVLEHVDEPGPVLREMRRVLRPGGLLVLTFDIAIDGDYEIPVPKAERVLDAIAEHFPDAALPGRGGLEAAVRAPDAFTTRHAALRDRASMPWRSPLMSTLGSLRHGFVPRSFGYRRLTVWSGALR